MIRPRSKKRSSGCSPVWSVTNGPSISRPRCVLTGVQPVPHLLRSLSRLFVHSLREGPERQRVDESRRPPFPSLKEERRQDRPRLPRTRRRPHHDVAARKESPPRPASGSRTEFDESGVGRMNDTLRHQTSSADNPSPIPATRTLEIADVATRSAGPRFRAPGERRPHIVPAHQDVSPVAWMILSSTCDTCAHGRQRTSLFGPSRRRRPTPGLAHRNFPPPRAAVCGPPPRGALHSDPAAGSGGSRTA